MALINLKQINGGVQLKATADAAKIAADKAQTEVDALEIKVAEDIEAVTESAKEYTDEKVVYNNDMATVTSLGGIAAGTTFDNVPVLDVLTKLLYPYVQPTVSASSTPKNGGTFEKGDNQTVTTIRAVVGKKSEKITKVEYFDGGNSLGVKQGTEVQNGGTFDLTGLSIVVSANKNFSVKVTDALNKTYTANTGGFNFVYPYYLGVCGENVAIDETLVKSLTKKVEGKGNKTQAFNCNTQRMVFAYPKAYGQLKQIIDANGFDVTNTFGAQELTITGLDKTPQAYYVYVNSASTVSNFNMKFNY